MNARLSAYVKKNYPDSKSDLFAVFIERCAQMDKRGGYQAMITQHAWMFLSSFEKLRAKLQLIDTVNMAHLGARGFDEIGGEVVQTTSFVVRSSHTKGYKGTYCRLIDGDSEKAKAEMFVSGENRYVVEQDNFSKIPGSPVAYWTGSNFYENYSYPRISDFAEVITGMTIGDNNKYLRLWYEPQKNKISIGKESMNDVDLKFAYWIPYSKGGLRRNWYGNYEYVVNWSKKDNFNRSKTTLQHLYLREAVTWPFITSGDFSARILPKGFLWDVAGSPCFFKSESDRLYALAFLCSNAANFILRVVNPTINVQAIDISQMPLIIKDSKEKIINLATKCISISRTDWDSFETSWDFAEHPLVKWSHQLRDATSIGATMAYYYHGERPEVSCPVELCYMLWQGECNDRFAKLKANEEELNRIFIDIYGLQDELTPEVEDKDVTVRKADLSRDIRSLLSYAVGCILGRYSLDKPGLAYAGGEWDAGKYSRFQPVTDNVIPLCDEEYFGEDDLVNRVVDFIKEVFGAASLEENLAFIAKALGNKGNTSREVIRSYFLKDFFADHCKIYQKRPIYWMFDSGKKNGFKALVYLHRWDADTTGRVNNNYLSPLLRTYAQQIVQENNVISASSDARTVSLAQKRLDKLKLQQAECEKYEKNIAHLAGLRIALDLDDGVKVNYVKAQTAADGKNLNVLAPLK